ncbi:possible Major surface glycoprotein [Prochlorococcus marinus subsp. pastoris str. CCMP1986]|uniref:Possible Major surface glycoprotein n=1 Tax=Prochlorococcus marinus subsp. pastoris (strain CCMP1986 / NIES-2087 / MED4) TaxID=59919 RepID=Q7TUB2_PROMP|nr:translation initiation factor IF-2 N-terminal domain-containing protein [Prochlorococcus marinus]KGF85884.1 putative Major surface glycoprotein [Prochlorococcus marinus str. EQPAC1]CAE19191.1 possible Major surface glycoprotein [Prochlorococcus marinus subsp. pastoris str. CCMP1986]
MASNTPIYSIAKELNIDSNRILLACKSIGINAKGATKRLNEEELEKVKNYFETGKNVSEEIVEINQKKTSIKSKTRKIKKETKISYFPNRLISKS